MRLKIGKSNHSTVKHMITNKNNKTEKSYLPKYNCNIAQMDDDKKPNNKFHFFP